MSACCNSDCAAKTSASPRYRRALWIALIVNALMFGVEIVGSQHSGSLSLFADAIDFAGDAANYAIALAVLGMSLSWRARAAALKGACMAGFGLFVLGEALWGLQHGAPPEALSMGAVALLALFSNVAVAALLYVFRDGDANMRSVWLCSRNDALSNIAVILAAAGVFGTSSAWPDILVALIMATLALSAGFSVMQQARRELSPR